MDIKNYIISKRQYNKGFEAGKLVGGDSYYDTFWDNLQDYGKQTLYGIREDTAGFFPSSFNGKGWNDTTFKPKYDMHPTYAAQMFGKANITDLKAILQKQNVVLDFSNYQYMNSLFNRSLITTVGVIDATNAIEYADIFLAAEYLKSIDKFVLPREDLQTKSTAFNRAFTQTMNLKHCIVEGTLCQKISLNANKIDLESAVSFINALKNYAGTDNEYTCTITFSSTTWGYLDAEGDTASPNGNSWRAYINDLGWNAS